MRIAAMYRSLRSCAIDVSKEAISFRNACGEILYVYRIPPFPIHVEEPPISFSVPIELQHVLRDIPTNEVTIEARNKQLFFYWDNGMKLKIDRIPDYFVDISSDPFEDPRNVEIKNGDALPF